MRIAKHFQLRSSGPGGGNDGHYIARITGPGAESNFNREFLTRDDLDWYGRYYVTVSQAGLYEVRDIDDGGRKHDSFVVFDGRNIGEATYEEALALAAHFTIRNLEILALTALMRDRKKRREKNLRKRELCVWLLDAAQRMGKLEHRVLHENSVEIRVQLPIKVFPRHHPSYIGFRNPTFCGKHASFHAEKGSPLFEVLMSKELNKLTLSDLGRIAKTMCKIFCEVRIIERMLAVILHADDADRKNINNLQKAVDLTRHIGGTDKLFGIDRAQYQCFLRLALDRGCQVSENQTLELLFE